MLVVLAVDQLQDRLIDLPESALLEIYPSRISFTKQKKTDSPTIRLPHTF
jgi:hypothetical protein